MRVECPRRKEGCWTDKMVSAKLLESSYLHSSTSQSCDLGHVTSPFCAMLSLAIDGGTLTTNFQGYYESSGSLYKKTCPSGGWHTDNAPDVSDIIHLESCDLKMSLKNRVSH